MKRAAAIAMTVLGAWLGSRAWRSRFSFAGKVVLISGGSRGLGLILARKISNEGGKVALLARDTDELERAKEELTTRGGEVLAIQSDLLERSQIQAAVTEVLARYGKIDVLFNNAGIIQVGPIENMQQQDFERAMSVHFWAPLLLIMEVLPAMRARRRGQPSLTLTFATRGAIVANALFPNLTGHAMKIGNRFLPGPGSQVNANDLRAGQQVRRIAPEWMTDLADRASAKNNELK